MVRDFCGLAGCTRCKGATETPPTRNGYPSVGIIGLDGGCGIGCDPGKEFQLRGRIGVIFSLLGDLRFLSHQDMLSMFARGVRRASLSIAYSQGYNPRPRLWLLLAKPLGVSCLAEILLVEPGDDCSGQEFSERLSRCLPAGIEVRGCFQLGPGRVPQPSSAEYSLQLGIEDAAKAEASIRSVMACESLPIFRCGKPGGAVREVDVRPYLSSMRLDREELSFSLSCSPAGSAKPGEVLGLLDLDTPSNRAKLVRTRAVYGGVGAAGWSDENNE